MLGGLVFQFALDWELPAHLLFMVTAAIAGTSIAKEGFSALIFDRRVSIDLLMVIAATGSFFIVAPVSLLVRDRH